LQILDKFWIESFVELALWQNSDMFWCVGHVENGGWYFYVAYKKSCVAVEELAFYFGDFVVIN
jgi:hypothetical protein